MQSMVDVLWLVFPEALLIAAACGMFLGAALRPNRHLWAVVALAALAAATSAWLLAPVSAGRPLPHTLFRADSLSDFVRCIGLITGIVFVLLSWNQVSDRYAGEFHACLLLIVAGVNLIAAANDLVALFLALELVSIPTYLLLYLPRHDAAGQEATVKYFLLSIFSSALVLFGFSYLYGSFGTTNLEAIRLAMAGLGDFPPPTILVVALVTITAGLAFRITAVPFHFYAPDVYQGAPLVGAALLAFVPKVAGFVALYQIIAATLLPYGFTQFGGLADQATLLFWILAAVSMFVGNCLALLQDNLKRLLAYSSIAHAGYMLIGLAAGRHQSAWVSGFEALWFYLVVYGIMTVGLFAGLIYLNRPERPIETVDDLAGLSKSHPLLALFMALFLFSLTGLPPAAGFWGKLNLFLAAWFEGRFLFQLLAVFLAVNAAIAGYYYLRVAGVMYLRSPVKPLPHTREYSAYAVVLACGVAILGLFVVPNWLQRVVEVVVKS